MFTRVSVMRVRGAFRARINVTSCACAHKPRDSHVVAAKPRTAAITVIGTICSHRQACRLLARQTGFGISVLASRVMASAERTA